MVSDQYAQQALLRQLTRTDPDPRVCRHAHARLLRAKGRAVVAVARLLETASHRVQVRRTRFLVRGRQGCGNEPLITLIAGSAAVRAAKSSVPSQALPSAHLVPCGHAPVIHRSYLCQSL
jgi:hypothetical protein